MDPLKKKISFLWGVIMVLLLFSVIAIVENSLFFLILMIIGLFLTVGFLPFARGYENLWMFLLVGVVFIPMNIKIVRVIMFLFFEYDVGLMVVVRSVIIYIIVLSAEEIIFGFATRKIWKKQRRLFAD